MLFNSYIFIFLFLPVCLLGFYLLKDRWPVAGKIWLIGMSLWFYGYFNLGYLAIMLTSIVFNFCVYRWLLVYRTESKAGKLPLIAGIAGNLGLLIYFKYTDFLIESCNVIFKSDIPLKHILLPLGISFFTFQQIGFIADTYRGETEEYDPVDYVLFVCFFPQLIAGPIVGHDQMMPQISAIGKNKGADTDKLARGIILFILGLSKKVLIADTFGKTVDLAYGSLSTGLNPAESLLTILFYSLQLYFDFSGYCDMAIGLGAMLGIDIPVNFDSPYKSRNIIEFWKRWHISLNRFLTKNVYIPLGGNRKGTVRTYVNLLLVFLISGIWHGAGVTFIIWGLMHGLLYVITRLIRNKFPQSCEGIFSQIFTFIYVCLAWVFFRADTVSDACKVIGGVFAGNFALPSKAFAEGFNLKEFWYVFKVLHIDRLPVAPYLLMILFTVFSLITVFALPNALTVTKKSKISAGTGIICGILLLWCILSLSGVSAFLYFNF